jgi:predicted TIM-barrel fold metal-dependent hydrolase
VTDSRERTAPPAGWDAHVHVFAPDAPIRPGHYRPAARPLAEIEAIALSHGIGHLVLVQPSVYGCDNRVLLDALRASPQRHRGIVVADASVNDDDLDAMHDAGVRGIRINLVSPVGEREDTAGMLNRLSPALRRLGWHVQWYADASRLRMIASLQSQTGLEFVLDHLAGMHAGAHEDTRAWAALASLAATGAWVKLSGWYRLRSNEPYADLEANIARIAALFGNRLVWGSDWPHTSLAADRPPAYESMWAPVPRVLGEAAARELRDGGGRRLYG